MTCCSCYIDGIPSLKCKCLCHVHIERGLYEHFKGGLYLVTEPEVTDSTNGRGQARMVLYTSLLTGLPHVRTLSQFVELVDPLRDGNLVPRFTRVNSQQQQRDKMRGLLEAIERVASKEALNSATAAALEALEGMHIHVNSISTDALLTATEQLLKLLGAVPAASPPEIPSAHQNPLQRCDDCRARRFASELITKGDHHGGIKTVCRDRDACHARSPG